VLAELHKKHQ
jgi:hypothetical protein